jgi:hypothetical protein
MKSVEFCYWLQGLFELANPDSLTPEQTALVKKHLDMVFIHEIDPSYPAKQQAALDGAHSKDLPAHLRPGGTTDGFVARC